MRNPLRNEQEMFRFLIAVIVAAIVIAAASAAGTWPGVAAAVLAAGGLAWWLKQPLAEAGPPDAVVPRPVTGPRRLLVLAPVDTRPTELRERLRAVIGDSRAEVLVVVPALATVVEAVTGAVDGRRDDAQREADALARQLATAGMTAMGAVGADEPIQAAEDALREFGADEVLFADTDATTLARAQERLAVPVSLLGKR